MLNKWQHISVQKSGSNFHQSFDHVQICSTVHFHFVSKVRIHAREKEHVSHSLLYLILRILWLMIRVLCFSYQEIYVVFFVLCHKFHTLGLKCVFNVKIHVQIQAHTHVRTTGGQLIRQKFSRFHCVCAAPVAIKQKKCELCVICWFINLWLPSLHKKQHIFSQSKDLRRLYISS